MLIGSGESYNDVSGKSCAEIRVRVVGATTDCKTSSSFGSSSCFITVDNKYCAALSDELSCEIGSIVVDEIILSRSAGSILIPVFEIDTDVALDLVIGFCGFLGGVATPCFSSSDGSSGDDDLETDASSRSSRSSYNSGSGICNDTVSFCVGLLSY